MGGGGGGWKVPSLVLAFYHLASNDKEILCIKSFQRIFQVKLAVDLV